MVAGEHDLNTPAGRMPFRQLGIIARYESEHRVEQLRLKGDELASNGRPHGGGYRTSTPTAACCAAGAARAA